MGRAKTWSKHMNILRCKAYVEASYVSRHGAQQEGSDFEDRIRASASRLISEAERKGYEFEP